jgi:hypothetical protein
MPTATPVPYSQPAPQIQAANPVSRALFNTAYRYKQAAMQRGDLSGGRLAPLWDRLVFSKVRARVGGGCLFGLLGAADGLCWRWRLLSACWESLHSWMHVLVNSPPTTPHARLQARCGC